MKRMKYLIFVVALVFGINLLFNPVMMPKCLLRERLLKKLPIGTTLVEFNIHTQQMSLDTWNGGEIGIAGEAYARRICIKDTKFISVIAVFSFDKNDEIIEITITKEYNTL